jgi:hypothetical protein
MAARLSALRAGRCLAPGKFLVLIFVRGWVDPRAIVRMEGLGQLKNSPHPGLEPATFQLVAYCLNQLRYHMPPLTSGCLNNIYETWYVYHGTWVHLNGVIHKSLPSVRVSAYVSLIVARQRLSKNVTAATSTHNTRIIGRVVFCAVRVVSREVGD